MSHADPTPSAPRRTNGLSFPEDTYLHDAARKLVYMPVPKAACTTLKVWFLLTSPELEISPDPATFNPNKFLRLDGHHYLLHDASLLEGDRTFRFGFVRNPWSRLVSAYLNRIVSREYEYRVLMKKRSRGPWWRLDRRLAYYARKHTTGQGWPELTEVTFREFVEQEVAPAEPMAMDPHWRPQHLFFGGHDLDFLGRFERLQKDVDALRERIGGAAPLPKRNDSTYAPVDLAPVDLAPSAADARPSALRELPAMPPWERFYTPDLVDTVGRIYAEDVERYGYDF